MRGALDAAMMFEAQALDLYMRCAERSEDGDRARILHELAEQEKSHLRVLGRLMDRMNRSRPHGEAPTSGGQSGEQSRKGD
jgi:rubrerythrin